MKHTEQSIVAKKYKCDKCSHVFESRSVKLVPATTNIKTLIDEYKHNKWSMLVAKDGTIRRGGHDAEEGDSTLHCPSCGELHLFGFSGV